MFKRLLADQRVQTAAAWALGLYLDCVLRSIRWTLDGAENLAPHAAGAPAVAACWHERLALMPRMWAMTRRMPGAEASRAGLHVLVSRHRDGRLIGAVIRRFRMEAVLGSSSRGGAAGAMALLRLLARGQHVVITPDGPRGPRRTAAPGVAQVAALSGAPVLPCSAQVSRRRVLGSWDRMVLPRPFGRGVVVVGRAISVPRDGWEAALPAISAALDAAADRADALCS
jgi:lysophospholipid acyltransferase (LPLAT)-like uncharacterized protein